MAVGKKRIDSLKEARGDHLACRDMGHCWTHVTDQEILSDSTGNIFQVTRWQRCMRCKAERFQVLRIPSFEIVRTRMKYPDEYLMAKGSRVSRTDARAESFNRVDYWRQRG